MQSSLSRLILLASFLPRVRGISTKFQRPIVSMISLSPNEAKLAWCRTAYVDPKGNVVLETVADGVILENDGSSQTIAGQTFDLTQSVDWMEYLEKTENRENDEGGAGAYDTMRCDIILSDASDLSRKRVIVWGQDFHLQRLQNSYLSLVHEKTGSRQIPIPDPLHGVNPDRLKEAMQQSNHIISALLAEAESSVNLVKADDDTLIQLFRVTLLWSSKTPGPIEPHGSDSILVRGHATSSCKPEKVHKSPASIVVSVATHSTDSNSGFEVDSSLPTRFTNPQNKIASWCRLRKQMEKPSYKPPGASEVLMVRQRLDDDNMKRLEVLEGLSSNFFVVYKDGTLRSPTEGVLHGYVRHLVLECACKVGLKFDPRPIFLYDTNEWQEAFITSSSRLIYPISKVLLPDDDPNNENGFIEFWKVQPNDTTMIPKWQELLQEILKSAGYD